MKSEDNYMKVIIIILFIIQTFFIPIKGYGQILLAKSNNVNIAQPKIMVIPYVKEGEDLRTILEQDVNKRIALTKVKEGFDSRGFTTVDFLAKLKSMKESNLINSDSQTDIKTQIIQASGADIYVQAEVSTLNSPSGNSVTIVLTAYEASTGNSLSNKVGQSGKFYTDDYGKLAAKAVESCIDDFITVMQSKFSEIVEDGKAILLDVSFDPSSTYKMSSEIGGNGLPLSDQIEEWVAKNSLKNNYHIQGTTNLKMVFDDIKIPLKDENGNNYTTNKYALQVFNFFRSLKIQPTKTIKSNTIYITLK